MCFPFLKHSYNINLLFSFLSFGVPKFTQSSLAQLFGRLSTELTCLPKRSASLPVTSASERALDGYKSPVYFLKITGLAVCELFSFSLACSYASINSPRQIFYGIVPFSKLNRTWILRELQCRVMNADTFIVDTCQRSPPSLQGFTHSPISLAFVINISLSHILTDPEKSCS